MPLLYRRLIFALFVLLFLIIFPVILIYSTGHTVNWLRFSLEKTGSILIDSEPNSATIFLNNEMVNDKLFALFTDNKNLTTKAKIKNLQPGEYTIRLEKNGYWPWEEKFRLYPGEVKNFNTIKLFKKTIPTIIYETPADYLKLSPSSEKLALVKNKVLTIINLKNEAKQTIILPNITKGQINWANDDNKLTIDNLIINLETNEIIDLITQINKEATLLRWSNDATVVYFVSQNKILRYTPTTKTITDMPFNQQLSKTKITDYLIKGDKVYVITQTVNNAPVVFLGSIEAALKTLTLPNGTYYFFNEVGPKPAIYNNKDFYLLDEPLILFSQPRLIKVSDKFKIGHWTNNTLLYASALEIRRWHNENQEYLITRLGSSVNDLWLFNNLDAMIIATPDDIKLRINGQDPFIISLASIKNTKLLTMSKNNELIYVYGDYDQKIGLFKIEL